MKPVPNILLSLLLLALCGLCAWQWNRERSLRDLVGTQQTQISTLTAKHNDLEARVKAANAEVLRITASLGELRANSVSKEVHTEALKTGTTLRDTVTKQNAAITQQNEMITKQNTAVQQANDNIKKLTTERDDLAKRLNEVSAKYNELIKKQ